MGFLIALITLAMVLDCIILIFLVLIQLPKKEAGAGLAFGASATDALFGAGSGNVLTKITKYAATCFFAIALLLSVLYNIHRNRNPSAFTSNLGKTPIAPISAPGPAPIAVPPNAATSAPALGTNTTAAPQVEATNIPQLKLTNPPAPANAPAPTQKP